MVDITGHPTREGKFYLCAIKDDCTNRIAGYSMADRMTSQLAVDAISSAIMLRRPFGAIVHSDRGSQFRSHAFVRALRETGLNGSMSQVGACADNATTETFFSLLQKNVLNKKTRNSREELLHAIIIWIETTHHRRRRQDRLGRMTPIELDALFKATYSACIHLPTRINETLGGPSPCEGNITRLVVSVGYVGEDDCTVVGLT